MADALKRIEEKRDRIVKVCAPHESPTLGSPHVTVNASALRELADDVVKLARALGSIAHNTCCEGCQEAARVAERALEEVASD